MRAGLRLPIGLVLGALALCAASAPAGAADPGATWRALKPDLFGDRPIATADGLIGLLLPERAEDAAVVPMTIDLARVGNGAKALRRLTLVIDENPAPVAAVFDVADGRRIERIEGRYRVDGYTHVRAVAELADGSLHMAEGFVKASGGCSAPATRDLQASIAELGRIRIRRFGAADPGRGTVEAQVAIRHPNWSGLQIDQETRGYLPARFVRSLRIADGRPLLSIESGISVAEDPTFRITWRAGVAGPITVEAEDTEAAHFRARTDTAD